MNRKSLGADIYSPIRFNGSHNDSMMSNADGSISEFYSGAFNTGYKKDNRNSLEPIKDDPLDFYEEQNEEPGELLRASAKKNNKSNYDLSSRKTHHLLLPDTKDLKSSCSSDKVFGTSPVSRALFSDKTTEKSPRTKEDPKNAEKQSKDRTKRSSKIKNIPDKFITVRSESRRSNLSPGVQITESSDLSQSSKSKEISSGLLEVGASSGVDCSSQTDLTLADLQILMNRVDRKSMPDVKSGSAVKISSEPCLVDPVTQPNQFQGNSLEKLKDTIDNEFHDIRQILYFQQLSLSKILYKNLEETENTNSDLKMIAESLNSIIGYLKDDQESRNTVLSQRFHS